MKKSELIENIETCLEWVEIYKQERDAAMKALRFMLELLNETSINKIPEHPCDHKHDPEKGHCDFCAEWTTAVSLVYGEDAS